MANTFILGNPVIEGEQSQHNSGFPIYVMTSSTETRVAKRGDRITRLWIYGRYVSAPQSIEIGVWDITYRTRQSIVGANFMGSGFTTVGAANGWYYADVNISLTAGREYAVGFNGNTSSFMFRSTTDAIDYSRSTATNLDVLTTSANPFPASQGGTDRHYSVYAEGEEEALPDEIRYLVPKYVAKSRVGGGYDENLLDASVFTIPWPTPIQKGDFALVAISWYEGSGSNYSISTPPDGFAFIGNIAISGSAGSESRVALYAKTLDGGEQGSVSVTMSGTIYGNMILDVYRANGPLVFAHLSTPTINTGTVTTATIPAVAVRKGQLQIGVVGLSDPPGAISVWPADMTQGLESGTGTNYVRTFYREIFWDFVTAEQSWTFANARSFGSWSILLNELEGPQ